MKKTLKFLTCFAVGYTLILLMRHFTPPMILLRLSLLFIITFGIIQFFYFWAAPTDIQNINLRLSSILIPIVAILTYIRHSLVDHNLAWYHIFPTIFAALLPFLCGSIYMSTIKGKTHTNVA